MSQMGRPKLEELIIHKVSFRLILIFYWCVSLTKADSYFAPYLLLGMIGTCCCIDRNLNNRSDIRNENRAEKVLIHFYATALSAAVILANYSFFTDLSVGFWGICRKMTVAILLFIGGLIIFEEVLWGTAHLNVLNINTKQLKNKKLVLGILWGVLVLEYALVLFGSQYPGELTPDSVSQMTQLLSHSYSNHHPYYHTQIIHVMISLGFRIFGEINKAVAAYSMFSIIVMSSCFTYVVETVYENGKNIKISLTVYIFYLVMPFHIIYSITMWKDVFFGAAVTCFVVSCYRCLKAIGNLKFNVAVLSVASVGMALLRSNGWVAFLISVIIFAILFDKTQKKMLLLFIIILASTYVLKHPVLKILQVPQPDIIESLSIPAQQISRVIADGKDLTEEQEQILGQVIDIEKIPETYSSFRFLPIKRLVREKNNQNYIKEHVADFVKVYVQLGIKYPHKYIEAWIDQTRGYWNSGYLYWRWATGVQENTLEIHRTVNCQFIDRAIGRYLEVWESSTFLQIFLSIGLYVWGIVIISYRALVKKDKVLLFTTIPFIAVILTLLVATPVFAEFRYAYAIFCGFPFVLAITFVKAKKENIASDIQG